MQITPLMIYFLDVLQSISAALTVLSLALIVAPFFGLMAYEAVQPMARYAKPYLITLAIVLACNVFIPSGKVLAAMYVIPAIVNSDAVQKFPSEIMELSTEYLKSLIKDSKRDK